QHMPGLCRGTEGLLNGFGGESIHPAPPPARRRLPVGLQVPGPSPYVTHRMRSATETSAVAAIQMRSGCGGSRCPGRRPSFAPPRTVVTPWYGTARAARCGAWDARLRTDGGP